MSDLETIEALLKRRVILYVKERGPLGFFIKTAVDRTGFVSRFSFNRAGELLSIGGGSENLTRSRNFVIAKRFQVYVLLDPREPDEIAAVRYVGATTAVLTDRLAAHVSEAKQKLKTGRRYVWIRELLSLGLQPVIRLLLKADSRSEMWIAEREAIGRYFKLGAPILNVPR